MRTVETVREGEERVRKREIGRTDPRRVKGGLKVESPPPHYKRGAK